MELLQIDECYSFCSINQRSSHTFLADRLLENLSVKCLNWGDHPEVLQWQYMFLYSPDFIVHLHGKEKLKEESSKFFILFPKKLMGLILPASKLFVWKILQQRWTMFVQIFSCTILTLEIRDGSMIGKRAKRIVWLPTLCSKPIVAHHEINSSIEPIIWTNI